MKRHGPSLVALLLLLLSGPIHARCAPGTTCFELCPEVELETSYNTAGKALRYLFNGSGSWIFATDWTCARTSAFPRRPWKAWPSSSASSITTARRW